LAKEKDLKTRADSNRSLAEAAAGYKQ